MPGHPKFCVYRGSTYVCIIDAFGGYGCPSNAEGSPPLRNKNATTDERGFLKLDVPRGGTHATPPLEWQRRYPHTDGWIEPWTRAGRLRPGLWLTGTHSRGACGRGSYETAAKAALRCFSPAESAQFDPCFPQHADWRHRDAIVACATFPGSTSFGRLVITRLR